MAPHHVRQQGQPYSTKHEPFFFRQEFSGLVVKGSFKALAVTPALVDETEWTAHQVVEQFRLVRRMLDIVQTVNQRTGKPICNSECCPEMTSPTRTYYLLNEKKEPVKMPAFLYIQRAQDWIEGKIRDTSIFPEADPAFLANPSASRVVAVSKMSDRASSRASSPLSRASSEFGGNYQTVFRKMYKQMMRFYAHLYNAHWVEPFWDLGSYRELNTCFIYFITVGRLHKLISEADMEPMQPLIDLWLAAEMLTRD